MILSPVTFADFGSLNANVWKGLKRGDQAASSPNCRLGRCPSASMVLHDMGSRKDNQREQVAPVILYLCLAGANDLETQLLVSRDVNKNRHQEMCSKCI